MNSLYRKQANQLFTALYKRGQTWTRPTETINEEWAEQFQNLATRYGDELITKVLNWYTEKGCGAIFVPIVGSAEAFCTKFDAINAARKRLRGQTLRYFDDILKYSITPRHSGSQAQKEHAECVQRLQQQCELVDALVNKRVTLPAPTPQFATNGHSGNGKPKKKKVKYSPFLAKARRSMTREQKDRLDALLTINREQLWQLIFSVPSRQQEFYQRLEKSGWFEKVKALAKSDDTDDDYVEPSKPTDPDAARRKRLAPSPGHNPRKRQREYKQGKAAFWQGERRAKNPYSAKTLSYQLWNEGWCAAEQCDKTNQYVAADMKAKYRK